MSYLLFMDESGHDGSHAYEVRGGIALPVERVWRFTQAMRGLEGRCFGDLLRNHGSELKAIKLLQKRRLRIARQFPNFHDVQRQRLCKAYFGQGRNGQNPSLEMAVAYAQAGVLFVGKMLDLVDSHRGRIFASIVPSGQSTPPKTVPNSFVRKDTSFLMERYYYFLEDMESNGILVLDETDRSDDRRYLSRLERYFSCHEKGKRYSNLIVPTPFFTASDMSYPVQAADIVIYLIAHGLRNSNMTAPVREDFKPIWIDKVRGLQYEAVRSTDNGDVFTNRSIVYVGDPWKRRS